MKIETKFSCGDKAWVPQQISRGRFIPVEVTVGQVRAEYTDSPGRPGEDLFYNYMTQKEYKEQYMCVETGIGSGSIYTLNEHIFATEDECREAIKIKFPNGN